MVVRRLSLRREVRSVRGGSRKRGRTGKGGKGVRMGHLLVGPTSLGRFSSHRFGNRPAGLGAGRSLLRVFVIGRKSRVQLAKRGMSTVKRARKASATAQDRVNGNRKRGPTERIQQRRRDGCIGS